MFLGGFRGNGFLPVAKQPRAQTCSGLGFFWTCLGDSRRSNHGRHPLWLRLLLDVFLGGFRGNGFLPVAKHPGLHLLGFRLLLDVFLGGFVERQPWTPPALAQASFGRVSWWVSWKRLPSRRKATQGSTCSGLGFFWTCFLGDSWRGNHGRHPLWLRLLLDVFLGGFCGNGFLPVAKQPRAPPAPVYRLLLDVFLGGFVEKQPWTPHASG